MSLMKKVGLIGVGRMGTAMARELLNAECELVAYDVEDDARKRAKNLGAKIVESPTKISEKSELIFFSLPDPDAVKKVLYTIEGLLSKPKKGLTIIDASTIGPWDSELNEKKVNEKGMNYLEAPVIGGPFNCSRWTLLVGGKKSVLDNYRDVLKILAKNVVYAGEIGSGAKMKLLSNILVASSDAITAEVMTLGTKLGLDPKLLFEALRDSPNVGITDFFRMFVPRILDRNFDVIFSLELMLKDLRLMSEMAAKENIPLFVTNSTRQLFEIAVSKGMGNQDLGSLVKVFEEWLGIEVRK